MSGKIMYLYVIYIVSVGPHTVLHCMQIIFTIECFVRYEILIITDTEWWTLSRVVQNDKVQSVLHSYEWLNTVRIE